MEIYRQRRFSTPHLQTYSIDSIDAGQNFVSTTSVFTPKDAAEIWRNILPNKMETFVSVSRLALNGGGS